jgi:ATP-binding cassette, subfamily C, bacterial CydD
MPDSPASIQRRLLSYSRPARLWLYLAIAAGFLSAALAVAQAWLLAEVVGRVFIDGKTLTGVSPILAGMLALAVARAFAVLGGDVFGQRSASHLKGSLRADLTQHILALGPTFTRAERSGELAHTAVQGVEDLDEYITQYQPLRFLALLVPIFVGLVILALDPPTVLILLVTGPLVLLFLAVIGSRAREVTQRRFRELGWMSASFLDSLQGLATLKMFGRSRDQIDTIRDVSRQFGKTTMEVLRTAFETAFVLEISTTVATALVAVEISLRLMDGGLPFNRALAVLIITPEFFLPLRRLSVQYHAGAAGKAAAERIFAVLDTPLSRSGHEQPPSPAMAPVRGDILFEGVSYAYEGGTRPALRDFSLRIERGQRVALVGPTGAGKTTVANLLLRFIEPGDGAITVDGISLQTIDPDAWRAQVAWVPQRPHLFYGTVAENLRLARPGATQGEVVAAARAANAHDFIDALPEGYSTPIGERGSRLSGGEQQRLAIARAFLKDAPLLILDEATSHLDDVSESLVREALDRLLLGRTVLVIAHRLKLAYNADSVVMMEEGRALESGTHHALLAGDGAYRQLVSNYEAGVS